MDLTRDLLEKKNLSSSSWFNTIAILSLINILVTFLKIDFMFPVGLGFSILAASVLNFSPDESSEVIIFMKIVGVAFLLLSLIIIGLFFLFRILTKKKKKGAYIAGIIIYSLDALLCLFFKDWISTAFHAWGIFSMVNGVLALRKLDALPITEITTENIIINTSDNTKELNDQTTHNPL